MTRTAGEQIVPEFESGHATKTVWYPAHTDLNPFLTGQLKRWSECVGVHKYGMYSSHVPA